jgi:hypothetical protein
MYPERCRSKPEVAHAVDHTSLQHCMLLETSAQPWHTRCSCDWQKNFLTILAPHHSHILHLKPIDDCGKVCFSQQISGRQWFVGPTIFNPERMYPSLWSLNVFGNYLIESRLVEAFPIEWTALIVSCSWRKSFLPAPRLNTSRLSAYS